MIKQGITRREREVTDPAQILDILNRSKIVHIAMVDGDEPYMVPMNYGFTMEDVTTGVVQKLIYRHPHVFANTKADTSDEVLVNWEILKRQEKGQKSTADAIECVPHTLPSLWRAEKLQSKTAKVGFTYTETVDALKKLEEEVRELREALESGRSADAPHGVKEEVGDVLFMACNVARMEGVEAEEALHCACDKFNSRFRAVEQSADKPLDECSKEELLALWRKAKENLDAKSV